VLFVFVSAEADFAPIADEKRMPTIAMTAVLFRYFMFEPFLNLREMGVVCSK